MSEQAIIEQVNADLKDSAVAHMPSGGAANSAWLVAAVMAYNLTRGAGILTAGPFGKARTGTIRRNLIHVPARIASSARKTRLHLPNVPGASRQYHICRSTRKPEVLIKNFDQNR